MKLLFVGESSTPRQTHSFFYLYPPTCQPRPSSTQTWLLAGVGYLCAPHKTLPERTNPSSSQTLPQTPLYDKPKDTMVYQMHIYVDGGCKGNGQPGSTGVAAAVFRTRWWTWFRASVRELPDRPQPTNQRAEITAIMLAIEKALERIEELDRSPKVRVVIYSDSVYAVKCMTTWVHKWANNGWVNSRGLEVANRDLIEETSYMDGLLREKARVRYKWISRKENTRADRLVKRALALQ